MLFSPSIPLKPAALPFPVKSYRKFPCPQVYLHGLWPPHFLSFSQYTSLTPFLHDPNFL